LVDCLESDEMCSKSGSCVAQEVWQRISSAIDDILESITLDDLICRKNQIETPEKETSENSPS